MLQETAHPASDLFPSPSPDLSPRPELDDLVPRLNPATTVRRPSADEVEPLWRAASAAVGAPLARPEVIARVIGRDPDSVWVFERSGRLTGGFAFIPLSTAGAESLVNGGFDPSDPNAAFLANPDEIPAAIYWWIAFKLEAGADGTTRVFEMLRSERLRKADIWGTANTLDGMRFMLDLGFSPAPGAALPNMYRYIRKANRTEPRDM